MIKQGCVFAVINAPFVAREFFVFALDVFWPITKSFLFIIIETGWAELIIEFVSALSALIISIAS